jgi:hypothetical protein
MNIALTCTGCGKSFEANDQFAGRKTKCPECGSAIIVPWTIVPQPSTKGRGRVADAVAIGLAALALMVAFAALGVSLVRDPLGSGLQNQKSNSIGEAAIFARLWDSKDHRLTPTLARHVLKVRFSDEDMKRMHDLAAKNQAEKLSREEAEELDNFIKVGDMLAILQSKARKLLGESANTAGCRI